MRLALMVVLVAVAVVICSSLLGNYLAGNARAKGVPEHRPGLTIAAATPLQPLL
jgi:hypothetical protein